MAPPSSPDRDELSVPDCSKVQHDGSCSPWKSMKGDDGRNFSYTDTASLTCSDSLNSSLTDTDEETCSLSPDNSLKTRHSRLSPIAKTAELPRTLHVIEDLSFDGDYSLAEEKIHAPSKEKKCQNRRRRLVWVLPLAFIGLVCYRFSPPARRVRVDPHDWIHFLQHEAPRVRRRIEKSSIPHSFTVRLSGRRSDLLERSVDVLTRCAPVEEVQVVWQSSMRPPRKLFRHESGKVTQAERLATTAVLLLDEDVIFTCDELERGKNYIEMNIDATFVALLSLLTEHAVPLCFISGFRLWRLNMDRMVGFFPYHHSVPNPQSFLEYISTANADPISPGSGRYEIVSSRGAFVHKEYLESFDSTEDTACLPFALSVHCTAISAKAPLAVAAHPQEQRASDIVPLLGHQRWARDEVSTCLLDWIEGHGMSVLPSEESTYLGA